MAIEIAFSVAAYCLVWQIFASMSQPIGKPSVTSYNGYWLVNEDSNNDHIPQYGKNVHGDLRCSLIQMPWRRRLSSTAAIYHQDQHTCRGSAPELFEWCGAWKVLWGHGCTWIASCPTLTPPAYLWYRTLSGHTVTSETPRPYLFPPENHLSTIVYPWYRYLRIESQ